jgi:hypothetical protein
MKKVHIVVILAIALAGIVTGAFAAGGPMTFVSIPTSGTVSTIIAAQSGSVDDIQAAINQAINTGATEVYIPAGTFTFDAWGRFPYNATRHVVEFTLPSRGLKIVGAGINQTVLAMPINESASQTYMFTVHGIVGSGRLEIANITFKGRPNYLTSTTVDACIYIETCQDFRVHSCSFYYAGGQGVYVDDSEVTYGHVSGQGVTNRISRGVVDHCYFYDIFKPASYNYGGMGYGVSVKIAYNSQWTPTDVYDNVWNFFGRYNWTTFVENCEFYGTRHAVQAAGSGCYVMRNCTVEDQTQYASATTGHPVREEVYGMGMCEIYNCTFRFRGNWPYSVWYFGVMVKGGAALIYNNTFQDMSAWLDLGNCEWKYNSFYPKGNTHDTYIWNNTVINCEAPYVESGGTDGAPAPQENVDYYMHAPNASLNYVAYPYPHPLTLEQTS